MKLVQAYSVVKIGTPLGTSRRDLMVASHKARFSRWVQLTRYSSGVPTDRLQPTYTEEREKAYPHLALRNIAMVPTWAGLNGSEQSMLLTARYGSM